MPENKDIYDDEIDLFEFFETLWQGKWIIIFASLVAVIVSVVFIKLKPNSYDGSTDIAQAKGAIFTEYSHINEVFSSNSYDYVINRDNVFSYFVEEFNDREELVAELKGNSYVLGVLEKIEAEEEKDAALIALVKQFQLVPPAKNQTDWKLKFEWHNADEGKNILRRVLNNILLNVKKTILSDIERLASARSSRNQLKVQKLEVDLVVMEQEIKLENDRRILFLKEQASIARALDIENNLFNVSSLNESQSNGVSLSVSSSERPFYLRGYKAIEAELDALSTRAFAASDTYVSIQSQLLTVKNDISFQQMLAAKDVVVEDQVLDWVRFDLAYSDIKSQEKPLLYVVLALMLGGIFGSLYILISNTVAKRKLKNSE